MKRSKFTEQQISFALKQVETGTPIEEVVLTREITEQTLDDGYKNMKEWFPVI